MGITVTLYKNFKKRENSTKIPAVSDAHTDFTCTLKSNTSVMDPVLEFYLTGQDPADTPIGQGFNYAYIPKWNRYYFIRNWSYVNGIWLASLNVDVLASYKSDIGALSKYVNRAASASDIDIADSLYATKNTADVSYVYSDNPFRVSPFGSYIVGVIGTQQTNVPNIGGINYYLFSSSQMYQFVDYLMSSTMANLMADPAAGLTDTVVKAITNPLDYIESCIWFPFAIDGVTTAPVVQPKLGWWDNIAPITGGLTPLGGGGMDSLKFTVGGSWDNSLAIPAHPQAATRGKWLNTEPYSQYVFHLDPWGDIPLDGQVIADSMSNINYTILAEGISGIGVLELYAGSQLLTRRATSLGVSISLAQIITDFSSMTSQSGLVAGATAGVASGGFTFKNLGKALGDYFSFQTWKHANGQKELKALFTGVGKDAASGVMAYNTKMETIGVAGSIVSFMGSALAGPDSSVMYTQGAWIKITRFTLIDEDLVDHGRPLCQIKTLSTLSGYLECADAEHDIAALDDEKDMIGSHLVGGFYYE